MKHIIITIFTLIFLILAPLYGQELSTGNISLVFCPLTPADALKSNTADIYSNELKTSLINLARFDIFHPKEEQLKTLETITLDDAVKIGIESGVDFVLFGTVAEEGDDIILHISIINPRIEAEVLALNIQTNIEMYRYDFKRLSLEIEQASMVASESALEYIKAYMEYGNYEKAQSALRNYVAMKRTMGKHLTLEEQAIKNEVDSSLAKIYVDEAERFLEADFFLEAQIRNKKALDLTPDNEIVKEQQIRIEERLDEYRGQELKSNLVIIDSLAMRKDFLAAMAIIDNLESNGIQGIELSAKKFEISSKIRAGQAYVKAKDFFRENEFDSALYEIEKAILLDESNVEYKTLQFDITKKMRIVAQNEEAWLRYEDEFDQFNNYSLFLKPKAPLHMESISYTDLTLTWSEPQGTFLENREIKLKGVGLREAWFFTNPFPFLDLPFSSMSLRPYAAGEIIYTYADSYSAVQSAGHNGIDYLSWICSTLNIYGGLDFQFFSFSLSGGLMAGMGILVNSNESVFTTNSSLNTESSQASFIMPLGGEIRLAWYLSEMVQLGFIYHGGSLVQDKWELAEWHQFDLLIGVKVY
jgi:TolB-like protein